MDAEARLIDARRLADELGMPVRTVYGLAARGELPHHRIGRAVRFDLSEVLRSTRCDDPGRPRSHAPRRSPTARPGSSLRDRMHAIERGRARAA
jgi:excisionase family DNA binding protein